MILQKMTMFFNFLFCSQTCVIKSCRSTSTQRDSFDLALKSGTLGFTLQSRIPMNIFSFFCHSPQIALSVFRWKRLLCYISNTFDVLLWSRLSLSFIKNYWNNFVSCPKVEQSCQTLFFIVLKCTYVHFKVSLNNCCSKIPKSGHKCVGLQSIRVMFY